MGEVHDRSYLGQDAGVSDVRNAEQSVEEISADSLGRIACAASVVTIAMVRKMHCPLAFQLHLSLINRYLRMNRHPMRDVVLVGRQPKRYT